MNETRKFDRRDERNPADALHAVSPIIRSAIGIVRESTGLLYHVAALGFALGFETKKPAPRRPARPIGPAANVIPFPATRAAKKQHLSRSSK